jgi:hypothetical protein
MKSVEEIIAKYPNVTLDVSLNQHSKRVINSKKLERANEIILKYGIPQELSNDDSIHISGVIKEVNADENTFVISVQSSDEKKNSKYLVVTIAEKLDDLVKKYWGNSLTISIKPLQSNGSLKQYELIEVQ